MSKKFKVGEVVRVKSSDYKPYGVIKDLVRYEVVNHSGAYPYIRSLDSANPIKYKTSVGGEGTIEIYTGSVERWDLTDKDKYGKYRPGDIVVLNKDQYKTDWKESHNLQLGVKYTLVTKSSSTGWTLTTSDPATTPRDTPVGESNFDFDPDYLKSTFENIFG